MALRFASAKVEKLTGIPTDVKPNQYYLTESGGYIQLWLSDSKSNLWPLINSGTGNGANVNKVDYYVIGHLEFDTVYEIEGSASMVEFLLPDISNASDNEEFSFAVTDEDGIRILAYGGAKIYVGDESSQVDGAIESINVGSFICLRAIAGNWIARYATGEWDITNLSLLTYNGQPVTYNGQFIYADSRYGVPDEALTFDGDYLLFDGNFLTFIP